MKATGAASPPTPVSVAMIPGLLSSQRHMIGRTDFRKGQLMQQMAQGKEPAFTSIQAAAAVDPKSNQLQPAETVVSTKPKTKPLLASGSTAYRTDTKQPKWLTHDRQVLRFFGYFEEPVIHHERFSAAPLASARVRRVTVFFYLTDNSISVSEPRVLNSGIPQGDFLKRSVMAKPNGSPIDPQDLVVGGQVKLCGRTIHLVDCDEATRTYYQEALAFTQSPPRKYPDDTSSQMDELEQLKQSLQQRAAAAAESKSERVRKFHAHSQQVLRFFMSWEDPHPLYPETRKYVLHYYLADDTMEIVEPKGEREGRGHFAVLLSRRRMASDVHKQHRFIKPTDLRCGEYVHVFARRFLLQDCDAFTRDYYLETHGVTQEKHEPAPAARRGKAAKWKLFEVNQKEVLEGLQLHDHHHHGRASASTEAAHQFYQNDAMEKKQLRFKARFHGLPASDANASREFVLTYYLEDDTLSVFEPRVKNSGVNGGRFLDRGRFRKCVASTDGDVTSREQDKARSTYKASDFYVGAVVAFEFAPQQRLELIEADRQTLLFCESHPQQFPYSDSDTVLQLARSAFATSGSRKSVAVVRRECRAMDASRSGVLGMAETSRLLEAIGVARVLNAQQMITLSRRFEAAPHAMVYDDFCDALASKTPSDNGAKDTYSKLRHCESLRRLLREADDDKEGAVGVRELVSIAAAFKVSLSSSEVQDIVRRHCGRRQGAIDYNALCDRVFDGPSAGASHSDPQRVRRQERQGADDSDDEQRVLHSLRHHERHDQDQDLDSEHGFGNDDDDGDQCLPPASPRRVPTLPLTCMKQPVSQPLVAPRNHTSDGTARVVALLRRVFGDRKYQLRKALRDRDHDKSGLLGEEAFMDAVLAVEPRLSDDDTYVIADVYFPTNNSVVDYSKLLEAAFRT